MIYAPDTWTAETFKVLRNCKLLEKNEVDGVTFVRCVPHVRDYPTPEARTAAASRVVANVDDPEHVCIAHNPDFGGDYVRVSTKSRAFNVICQMKS